MENWQKELQKAIQLAIKSDKCLQKSLKLLLNSKGIQADNFYICFASSTETIVHHQNESILSDLDINILSSMTEDDIKEYYGIQNY